MEIVVYCPFTHYLGVEALWEKALGDRYPVSRRVLAPRIAGRSTLEWGDGLVALDGERVVGFGVLEIDRAALLPANHAGLPIIVIDPAYQRRGIGSAILRRLEDRALALGCRQMIPGGLAWRFWSGVPEDLPGAKAFLEARGYELMHSVVDLVTPLEDYQEQARYREKLEAAGAAVVSAAVADLSAMLDFQGREFPNWLPTMLTMVEAGDLENVLLVKHGSEIVGSILTYTPQSRFRAANLVWERLLGEAMGGYGAVGIAAAWRGRGLGAAMCQAAALHVKRRGGTCALIDWTNLTDFYGKVGAKVWRKFWRGKKALRARA